jgi:phosphoribosylformylglycinamidine synthase
MKFKAEIDIMPQDALLDPQGKAVTSAMQNIGLIEIDNVRIGRHIRLFVECSDAKTAEQKVEEACQKLLANQIMETYRFTIEAC